MIVWHNLNKIFEGLFGYIDKTISRYYALNYVNSVIQESISPTFYKQLLRHYSFAKKYSKPNCKYRKAAQNTFVRKRCT